MMQCYCSGKISSFSFDNYVLQLHFHSPVNVPGQGLQCQLLNLLDSVKRHRVSVHACLHPGACHVNEAIFNFVGLVVSRAPDLNSKRNSGPYPPPSIHSVPPTSLRSHPPPSVHSQPPPSIHSPPPPSLPPPSTHSYSSGWSADLESEIGSGPFPPNPGPLYEDRSDGFGPRPHSPAPLPDIGESNDRYGNVDPEFGAMPPPPPPLANPDVDHEDSHYSPVVPPSWDTQVLNNSLPMSVQSLKTSPGPTLILPPQGHPLDHTSGSSSTSSLSFAAIQGHASELERTADALGAENLQLRRENTQLQRENTQLQQRVAWLEAELHRYCAVASFTPDMPNNQ